MIKTIRKIDLQGNEYFQEVCICNRCKRSLDSSELVYETKWISWHPVKMQPGTAYGFGQYANPIKHLCTFCQGEVESFINGGDLKFKEDNPAKLLKTEELISLYNYDGTPESVKEQILEELADRV